METEVDAFDFKGRSRNNDLGLRVSPQNGEIREFLGLRCHSDSAGLH